MVMGFCIGGPSSGTSCGGRRIACVRRRAGAAQRISRPEMRDLSTTTTSRAGVPELVKRRPEITMEMVDKFLTRMYRTNADFVFTVTRDFVRTCQTPV
jgi:hypothetical protein